ncbi:hypothetical protein [Bradyrhizobium jicamae]|uniref:hypothetical protein n=1 Tax=Bradyrhizobium jicamae TaxID=280332 RepID=UPI001BA735D3|nr:hypothetical protein [Bradyrhizobium jicamae]MBR0932906.1 hypothetical protein [Bradyrhizobium jicamae]
MMTPIAMIPFGAWLAFTVATIVTISGAGSGIAGTCVFLWGCVVMLAGGSARLSFLLAFVGIFGGPAAFGLMGLFVGPVIMAGLLAHGANGSFVPGHRRWDA